MLPSEYTGCRFRYHQEAIEGLFAGSLSVVHLDEHLARRAGELRVEHYHRSRSPLSLADVILIASAKPADRIATADPDVLADRRDTGHRDSRATRPGLAQLQLGVNRPAVDGAGGFEDRLRDRRVGMDDLGQLLVAAL